jgi:hypothetical protein
MMVNEAGWDRIVRIVLGVVMLVVGFGLMDGAAGVVVGVAALVPLLTGLVGWCPLYSLFRIRTSKTQTDATAS